MTNQMVTMVTSSSIMCISHKMYIKLLLERQIYVIQAIVLTPYNKSCSSLSRDIEADNLKDIIFAVIPNMPKDLCSNVSCCITHDTVEHVKLV